MLKHISPGSAGGLLFEKRHTRTHKLRSTVLHYAHRSTSIYLAPATRRTTQAKQRQRYRGVWQPRFFEHTIRNYADFKMHLDYIHSNPVKHGLAASPQAWPWSSFHRYVREGEYDMDWCGHITLPSGTDIEPEQW